MKLAVLSNKYDQTVRDAVDRYFGGRFGVVRGERDGVPHKPDPAAALEIASELGVPPARSLYLGDTNTDMRTAVAAGMYPVGVLWGFRPAEELLASGARTLIAKPADLLALL